MAPRFPANTPLTQEQLEQLENDAARESGIEDDTELGSAPAGDADPQDAGDADPDDAPRARREVPAIPPGNAKRQAIVDKFRRSDVRPFDGDMTKPQNIYGEVADEHLEPDPDLPEPGVPEGQAVPKKTYQLTIRGKTVEMSEEEVLERARKVEAADSYLAESRALLEEAKEIKAERAGRATHPPEGDNNTQDDGRDSDQPDQQRLPHGHDLKAVIEKIQFGDPEEAAALLAETIQRAATTAGTKAANEGHVQRLISNDLARSQQQLKAFQEANADLAKDEIAGQLIEQQVYKIYRDEIKALGMEESQIPTNPKDLADWHRFYRVNGAQVSQTSDILNKAKDKVLEWRGGTRPTNEPAKPQRQDAPRVDVNVDRTERRKAIPLQPARAVAPRRDAAPPATVEQSRKNAVLEMRKARGQQ